MAIKEIREALKWQIKLTGPNQQDLIGKSISRWFYVGRYLILRFQDNTFIVFKVYIDYDGDPEIGVDNDDCEIGFLRDMGYITQQDIIKQIEASRKSESQYKRNKDLEMLENLLRQYPQQARDLIEE